MKYSKPSRALDHIHIYIFIHPSTHTAIHSCILHSIASQQFSTRAADRYDSVNVSVWPPRVSRTVANYLCRALHSILKLIQKRAQLIMQFLDEIYFIYRTKWYLYKVPSSEIANTRAAHFGKWRRGIGIWKRWIVRYWSWNVTHPSYEHIVNHTSMQWTPRLDRHIWVVLLHLWT